MKQQYFTTTMISKFIKYLLAYTPLPTYPTISTDDIIIEGCTYVYKYIILKCTKTGLFKGIKTNQQVIDYLYVNEYIQATDNDNVAEHLYRDPSNPDSEPNWKYLPDEGHEDGSPGVGGLTVTDDAIRYFKMPEATFEFVDYYNFGNDYLNLTHRFISNTSYYDSETHRYLGEYLRCLRDIYDLNLMGMYNCFNYDFADNISLKIDERGNGIVNKVGEKTKLMLVPIKFNKTYTIAMDCSFPILMRSVIYDGVMLKDSNGDLFIDRLDERTKQVNGVTFSNPITYSVVNEDAELQHYESRLYLAIQVPKNLKSSIVILEGDYSNSATRRTINIENLNNMSAGQVSDVFRINPSLLESNDGNQYPFADKLIAYLLRYTIDTREYIDENIARIERAIKYKPTKIKEFREGIWDLDLRWALFKNYIDINNRSFIDKNDITGFVDKDIENAAMKGWIEYAKHSSVTD